MFTPCYKKQFFVNLKSAKKRRLYTHIIRTVEHQIGLEANFEENIHGLEMKKKIVRSWLLGNASSVYANMRLPNPIPFDSADQPTFQSNLIRCRLLCMYSGLFTFGRVAQWMHATQCRLVLC